MVAAAALLALLVAVLFARPEALLFHPLPHVGTTPASIGWDFEAVELRTEDGETLAGWYLPADPQGALASQAIAVLYCHGNAGNIGGRMPALEGLRPLGVSVLIFDYRGYGESSGRPTVPGTRLDVDAAWRHLVEVRGFTPAQIVLWGRSLGGAIAIDQAARQSEAGAPPMAVVVESSFTSTLELGAELYPWLPVRSLGKGLEYPSREHIATVSAPVLIAHSPDDDLIPAAHGDALRAAAEAGVAPRVDFVSLTGGHNGGHLTQARYRDAVVDFLAAAGTTGTMAGARAAQPSLR
nr:alpha/beta hydrolase [Pseudenhygromyxa sp. WMMC2535]